MNLPELQVLGTFRLCTDRGETRSLRTRKAESLLAFLICEARPVSRDTLRVLLWPDDAPDVGRQKLRLALLSIRLAITDLLITDRQSAQVCGIGCDLKQFLESPPQDVAALRSLRPPLEANTDGAAARLRDSFMIRLARAWKAAGDHAVAEEAWRVAAEAYEHALEIEPGEATDHMRLLRAYRQAGDSAGVRRQQERLHREFGRPAPASYDHESFPSSALIGRDTILRELVSELLAEDEPVVRILFGPPGIGKSRLAAEVAARARSLRIETLTLRSAAIQSADQLDAAMGVGLAKLGVALGAHPLTVERLRRIVPALPPTLVVLDATECVPPEILEPRISALLTAGSSLRILVTTHRRCETEVGRELAPLRIPERNRAQKTEAVSLFLARASGLNYNEATANLIGEICRAAGGIPLAIELAAAWTDVRPLEEILTALLQDEELATRRRSPRHEGLRHSIERSIAFLTPEARAAFLDLSVFRRGASPELASKFLGDRGEAFLAELADRSLLLRSPEEGNRLFMLGPIATAARSRSRVERPEAAARHAALFLELAEGGDVASEERANLQAAFDYFGEVADWRSQARMIPAMHQLWWESGEIAARNPATRQLYESLPPSAHHERALVAYSMGVAAYFSDRLPEATEWFEHMAAHREAEGDLAKILRARQAVGAAYSAAGELEKSDQLYRETLPLLEKFGPKSILGVFWITRANDYMALEQYAKARTLLELAIAAAVEEENQQNLGIATVRMGYQHALAGELVEAKVWLERALELARQSSEPIRVEESATLLVQTLARLGDDAELAQASALLIEAAEIAARRADRSATGRVAEGGAFLANARGRFQASARLLGAALSRRPRTTFLMPGTAAADETLRQQLQSVLTGADALIAVGGTLDDEEVLKIALSITNERSCRRSSAAPC